MIDQVTIRPADPAGDPVVFELLEDDTLTGQVGGWESLPRPRRTAAAGWVGLPETDYTLVLMLDGTSPIPGRDRPVERQCAMVESWGRPVSGIEEPPKLRITGPVLVDRRSRWVLQGIEWGARIRDERGRRVQQVLTLTLLKHVDPVIITSPAAGARARAGKE